VAGLQRTLRGPPEPPGPLHPLHRGVALAAGPLLQLPRPCLHGVRRHAGHGTAGWESMKRLMQETRFRTTAIRFGSSRKAGGIVVPGFTRGLLQKRLLSTTAKLGSSSRAPGQGLEQRLPLRSELLPDGGAVDDVPEPLPHPRQASVYNRTNHTVAHTGGGGTGSIGCRESRGDGGFG